MDPRIHQQIRRPDPKILPLGLDSVDPLLAGRTEAPDRPKRQAVSQEHIDAVKAVLRQRPRDIIDLLLLTGARPGEILMLTTGMLDRSGEVWIAELKDHKMVHHGDRLVPNG